MTEYTWDYRNRLTKVLERASAQGPATKVTEYSYDVFDRRVGKDVDDDGDQDVDRGERYVYDGQHIALQFDGDDDLTHRYLFGPAVDQILADEDASGDVLWPLADHEGTVRDLAEYDSGQDETTVVNHVKYDAFGNITAQSNSSLTPHFAYTGREWDPDAGLYYYRARWYDAKTGRFLSEDPVGFAAGDANLHRYVFNNPLNFIDPSGMSGGGSGGSGDPGLNDPSPGDPGGGDDSLLGHPTWGPGNPYYDAMNSPPGILLNPGYWMPLFPSITVDWPHRITIIVPIFGTATPDLPAGGPTHVVPVKPGGPTVPKLPPWIRPIPGAPGHYGPVLLLPGKGGQIGIGVKPGVGLGPDGRPTFHPSISIGGEIKW